eukprot:CAMPEP_0172305246 /NCGR_PEP_ID=MMETSP1058-20130122/6567_1 /TAXON_ID=83371 /ORGANISM="Detonula confervacea, Strain CCMP 353" /LENGTH=160 /DNA_ID=CAMNT_0013016777 /DNA_START=57 /DNA_END=539 /DNA_ORIENTATION=-
MTRFTLLAIALAVESACAFAPAATSNHATAMYLVPEDGRQLVAFSQDYLSKKAKESASKASNLTSSQRRRTNSKGLAAAARSLMTRLLGDEDKARVEEALHHHPEDEVLYPMVGFTLVDGTAVPDPGQQAACNLHLQRKGEEEEIGNWSGSPHGGDSLCM